MTNEQSILIPSSNDGTFSVLQLSDMHLFSEENGKLLGVHTASSFQAVLDAVSQQNINFDLVLVTGDIAQDYSEGAYVRFSNMVKQLNRPVYWLPGNHDDGPKMRRIMPGLGISAARNVVIGNWQFILLNTQVYSSPLGWITDSELEYARMCINRRPELNAVVCLHHNSFYVNSSWLDQHTLKNKEELLSLAHSNSQIKLVLCGHVHQEHDFVDECGLRFISSPSTSIQFAPYSFNFSLDAKGPGWRYVRFYPNGSIETFVNRLEFSNFIPDFAIGGY
ncbi:MAG: 3',5'-cyclic-AMP phosphodiesterase [Succinivibrionaceae bacterium]